MRTMKTVQVAGWLSNQGMVEAKDNFLSTFGHMENVDYRGIEGFLYLYYRDFAGDVFLSMQCQIEDQEVRVMVKGYEGGVDDIVIGNSIDNNITPAIIHVALDVNTEWYYGKHERVDDMYDATNSEYHIVKAIIL